MSIPNSALRPPPSSLHYRWLWSLVAVPPLLVLCLVLGVANCFRQTSDLTSLRTGLTTGAGVEWHRQISIHANALTFDVIRWAVSRVHMDPTARAALQSIRGVDVGLYHLTQSGSRPDRASLLAAADGCMAARGWDRLVGVIDSKAMVAVYVPTKIRSPQNVRCCVVVQHDCELVLVSARANPEALVLAAPWRLASAKWQIPTSDRQPPSAL